MIRVATTADIETIIALLVQMHSENIGYSDFPPDVKYVQCSLRLMLPNPNVRVFLDEAGRGFLMAQAVQDWFAPRIRVAEEVLYVHPAHRGSTLAWRLVKRLEEWAKEIAADRIVVGVSTGSNNAVKLYERTGFTRLGETLVKRLGES